MGKAKLRKFAEVKTFPNVFQNYRFENPQLIDHRDEAVDFKGKWRSGHFKNQHPIVLELACGKGDYTIGLAKLFPEKNFIGIDIKGSRIWTGAKYAVKNEMKNVAFVRTNIEFLPVFFEEDEVDEIWITFPDPFPRHGDSKRRLTSHKFLKLYQVICKTGGLVHLKTDNLPLFHFSKSSIESAGYELEEYQEDIYSKPIQDEQLNIQTYYEKKHLADNRTINYLNFRIA